MDLTDEQWQIIGPILALPGPAQRGRGRPPQDSRAILNGIFYKIRTGVAWDALPAFYPSQQTCRRYLRAWTRSGSLTLALRTLHTDLSERGGLSIRSALRQRDIHVFADVNGLRVEFAPHLQNTWQASTALVIVQFIISRAMQIHKRSKSRSTSTWAEL